MRVFYNLLLNDKTLQFEIRSNLHHLILLKILMNVLRTTTPVPAMLRALIQMVATVAHVIQDSPEVDSFVTVSKRVVQKVLPPP